MDIKALYETPQKLISSTAGGGIMRGLVLLMLSFALVLSGCSIQKEQKKNQLESTMNTIINYKLNTVEEEHSSEINKWLANARETGEEGQYFTYSYSDNTKENMYLYVYRKGYRNYEVSFIYDPSDSNYPGKIHVTGINKDKENDDFVQIQSINDLSIQIILSDESLKNKLK